MIKYCIRTLFKVTVLFLSPLTFAFAQVNQPPAEKIFFSEDDTQRCLKCHGMANFVFRDSTTLTIHNYSVAADTFRVSVHGKLSCQQCHTDIKQYPHAFTTMRVKVTCGDNCHAKDEKGINYTHQSIVKDFQESAHRKGLTDPSSDSPRCVTCHGNSNPHGVAKAGKATLAKDKIALCISCHSDKEMMVKNNVNPETVLSYKRSFHYKAIRFGATSTATCQDCHTTHHILPKDSLNSSIADGNIAATCGQDKCHPGAKMNFAMSGANHLDLRVEREPILKFEEQFFNVLTLGTLVMLIVGIILDVQKKFGWLDLLEQLAQWMRKAITVLFKARVRVYAFIIKILID